MTQTQFINFVNEAIKNADKHTPFHNVPYFLPLLIISVWFLALALGNYLDRNKIFTILSFSASMISLVLMFTPKVVFFTPKLKNNLSSDYQQVNAFAKKNGYKYISSFSTQEYKNVYFVLSKNANFFYGNEKDNFVFKTNDTYSKVKKSNLENLTTDDLRNVETKPIKEYPKVISSPLP